MREYHVALSFAGEDRKYVDKVATHLRDEGVNVFYDKFEEAELWGKDLYVHLSNIYQNRAMFTVMFISESYGRKAWPNHERKSAQARAISENQEYILPAFFDESVEVPGLLNTTGRIALTSRTPEQLAKLIVQKLNKAGVRLSQRHTYADEAKADVDYPLTEGGAVVDIIKALRSYNWYTQNPAVEALLKLDWSTVSADEAFVLGRNLYQCACGGERKAVSVMNNIRRALATFPIDRALDVANGMFFEAYFDSKGEFRSERLKGRCLAQLFTLQTVKKFEPSITFIRRALEPYMSALPVRPNAEPEFIMLELTVQKGAPPVIRTLKVGERSLLHANDESSNAIGHVWRLSYQSFTIAELRRRLADEWSLPIEQIIIRPPKGVDANVKLRIPDGMSVIWRASK
jgi:TIR domain